MEQLLLHLLGDYLIQNDWMAQNKKKKGLIGEIACQLHCMTYSLPFLLIGSPASVLLIYIFHYLIDRYNFISWFMEFTGKNDFAKPPFAPWSQIIIDNSFHLILNFLILYFFK